MGIDFQECQEMISACEKSNIPLFVAYYRRALSKFIKIKELIEDGTLGDIRLVNVQLYRQPLAQDYDKQLNNWWKTNWILLRYYFMIWLPHMIDLLYFQVQIREVSLEILSNQKYHIFSRRYYNIYKDLQNRHWCLLGTELIKSQDCWEQRNFGLFDTSAQVHLLKCRETGYKELSL